MSENKKPTRNILNFVSDECIKDLLLKGHTTTEIAYILNCDLSKLYKRIAKIQGIEPGKDIKYTKKRTIEEIEQLTEQIIELVKKGYIYSEVAQRLNVSFDDVCYMLKRKKVDTKKLIEEGRKNREFLEDAKPLCRSSRRNSKEIDVLCVKIVELLNKGYNQVEVKKTTRSARLRQYIRLVKE